LCSRVSLLKGGCGLLSPNGSVFVSSWPQFVPNHPIHEPTPASGRLLARVIGARYAASR